MGEKIAMGFHATVDFELKWDLENFLQLATDYKIRAEELQTEMILDSERNMLIVILAHMKQGSGAEFTPDSNSLCMQFAERFSYKSTLGGTATRAALAVSRLEYGCELSVCCFNKKIREGMPEQIHYFSNVGEEGEEICPHVVFTYPAETRIRVNDIDFVTPRENRIMFSNDETSKNMAVSTAFQSRISEAEVFLLGCFSEVLNFDILEQRLIETKELLEKRNREMLLVFEDGCYIQKSFRTYVHRELVKCGLDILSMNEDELQELTGRRFDILNAEIVLEALELCRNKTKVPILVVHTSKWALAYGDNPQIVQRGLKTGIGLSTAHFCYGSQFEKDEFRAACNMPSDTNGVAFCHKIRKMAGDKVCVFPTKDLSSIKEPTVVGLGDCFAGGLVLGLTEDVFTI